MEPYTSNPGPYIAAYELLRHTACRHCDMLLLSTPIRRTLSNLDALVAKLAQPVVINSGYRCPAHNLALANAAPLSRHLLGAAVDLAAHPALAAKLIELAGPSGFEEVHHDPEKGYVHLGLPRHLIR